MRSPLLQCSEGIVILAAGAAVPSLTPAYLKINLLAGLTVALALVPEAIAFALVEKEIFFILGNFRFFK